jgi:hypothetical protein
MNYANSLFLCILMSFSALAGPQKSDIQITVDKFKQMDEEWPTPNVYRNAAGAPGHQYWQQRADYKIKVSLDDDKQQLSAESDITYYNNSPDTLRYLWLQLDQNKFALNSDTRATATAPSTNYLDSTKGMSYKWYRRALHGSEYNGGFDIQKVTDGRGNPLNFVINKTMMRVDLPKPLRAGSKTRLAIKWNYQMHEQKVLGGRSGYEYFKEDKNYLYEVAQWFPRMAAYYDVYGWQNKQFLGRGEFALEFGDYDVEITVPADHIVAATGELQNENKVLSSQQKKRLKQARKAKKPVVIVTEDEAIDNEKQKSNRSKTWHFTAKNVRDFAWASSRKFIWDAQHVQSGDQSVLAMSYYPKEGNPLWEQYSTQSIVHTIEQYNKYSIDYPYPTSISVNGPVGGMEYPMITFNGPRPTLDKKTGEKNYSRRTKYGLISVIIHEVGHNYYPMIINSDERQWTWMDEGLNTFVQFLAEKAWEEKYPSWRGEARDIVPYMRSTNQVPIMTNSESILQFGNNAYGKPATALNILRETIMGRELFDFAFKEYARRWKFKRPTPSDFFRTMEDASAVDLDWFWRGWFYSTEAVDISIDNVKHYSKDTLDPEIDKSWQREQHEKKPLSITEQRNAGMARRVDQHPELKDFYNDNDQFTVTNKDRNNHQKTIKKLEDWQKELIEKGKHFYTIDFSNLGGLVMPIILQLEFEDGSIELQRYPAEIWKQNHKHVSKLIITDKALKSLSLDPYWETADVDVTNNYWPKKIIQSRFKLYQQKKKDSLMKNSKVKLKTDSEEEQPAKADDTEVNT